ncbi:MAG: EamA family transporter [bacterium]|nr:MAG: EamA family transporter [bacterium]
MLKDLFMIILIVVVNTVAQFTIKAGVKKIGTFDLVGDFVGSMLRAFTSWIILIGFALYFSSALLWLIILSRRDLSWAYPLVSLSYVIIVLASPVILNEHFSVQRLLGSLVICLGVYLVFRT